MNIQFLVKLDISPPFSEVSLSNLTVKEFSGSMAAKKLSKASISPVVGWFEVVIVI